MKRKIHAFTKRFTCLVLALVLTLCLVPDVTPKAKATGLAIPTPSFMPFSPSTGSSGIESKYNYQSFWETPEVRFYVDGADNLITSLYTVMQTL